MIYHFNPSCEMAVRQDRDSYTPPRGIASMEDDLAALMAYVGSDGDGIVGQRPDDALLDFWAPVFGRRVYIGWDEASRRAKDGEPIAPWGMSRAELRKFGLTEKARDWQWRDLLSRRTSVETEWSLARMTGADPVANPMIVRTENELRSEMRERLRKGVGAVVKSLWSASGRGVRFFREGDEADAVTYGINCIGADGGAVIETRLSRQAEFSYLFRVAGDDVTYEGINRYHSTDGGAMGWEMAGPQPNIPDLTPLADEIDEKAAILTEALRTVLGGTGYEGPVGVDAMTYRVPGRGVRLRPCTEVNVRHCMGHVAQGVLRGIADGVSVKWCTWHFGDDGEWDAFCARGMAEAPIVRDSQGRIVSGFFRLTTAGGGVRFGAAGWAGEMGVVER